MEFTLNFLKIFPIAIKLVAPMLMMFVCIIVTLGQVVARLEKWQPFEAFYWSFVTATTVGYGDLRPTTKTARCLSLIIAMTGLIFTGLVIAVALQAATIAFNASSEFDVVKQQIQNLNLK